MPRMRKAKDSNLARLALGLARRLYEIADGYWTSVKGCHVCEDSDCYPGHVQSEFENIDRASLGRLLSGRRGNGAVFYLNASCLKGRVQLDAHDYTFTRYEKRGVFGDALERRRYEANTCWFTSTDTRTT